mmetsp:Transcript_6334/g.15013  ORF Transcript_6334/g.15013 Transcript_6334/m.15013 type:complete len:189 (-) Transcript_6334:167-733(-)
MRRGGMSTSKGLPAGHAMIEVTKRAAELWKAMSAEEKFQYEQMYAQKLEDHKAAMKEYKSSGNEIADSPTTKRSTGRARWNSTCAPQAQKLQETDFDVALSRGKSMCEPDSSGKLQEEKLEARLQEEDLETALLVEVLKLEQQLAFASEPLVVLESLSASVELKQAPHLQHDGAAASFGPAWSCQEPA